MGTRGFITFVAGGVEKTAYNHNGSYPGGLGLDVLTFLRANRHELVCELHSGQVGSVPDKIRKLRVLDENVTPTPEDIERLSKYVDTQVGTQRRDDWYVLLRHTQGDPGAMLQAGVIEDASSFPADSLFAEWGFVIDLDNEVFEAYRGFQRSPHTKGRFAEMPTEGGYYPVALVKSWPLAELPSDEEFLAALPEDEDA